MLAHDRARRQTKGIIPFIILIIASLICVSSCTSLSGAREPRLYVYLTNDSRFFLLPPWNIEKPMDMIQHVSASFGRQNLFLNAWVKADKTKIEMRFFNELGANMGELLYIEETITFTSSVFPESLRPEYIVADFQLSFYSPYALCSALAESGLTLEIQDNTRRIFKGNDLIIEIEKTPNAVRFTNHLRGYAYTLEGNFK
ncbi:MAG: DUF3261 domain-containing protein [Spirochaetes bacterium]|nr:DUF3261 domain-containing protein [Spirochaetota bacterium]